MNLPTIFSPLAKLIFLAIGLGVGAPALAQFEFEREPIEYSASPVDDTVARLIRDIDSGRIALDWNEQSGWLPSLMEHLQLPVSSQTLVFSKTSLQINHISPNNPRALYFNDETYLGYVPGGDLIEISSVDPQLGAVFYSIEQIQSKPQIVRDQNRCLTCHATSKTQNVPGYLVRSVFPSASGHPHYGMGTQTTDHRTDFGDRFGGWYITGDHGQLRHRGNQIATKSTPPIDVEAGANHLKLPDAIRPERYLHGQSDLIALMLLEHQSQMHNMITQANYETREALHYQQEMNHVFERDSDYQSESTQRRIRSAAEKLVEYLFFCNEFRLTSPIAKSEFAVEFSGRGPFDSAKRSLRELDLETRLLKYPCSYLVYSKSFDQLPTPVLEQVARRMHEILTGIDSSSRFDHLSAVDRLAILEILQETQPNLARYWSALPANEAGGQSATIPTTGG